MNVLRMAALALSVMALSGCAAIALTAGSVAAGAGVDHTLSGIVYKTFASSMAKTRLASLKTLKRMDMDVVKDEKTEEGWLISATATEREIDIELEALSKRTTRPDQPTVAPSPESTTTRVDAPRRSPSGNWIQRSLSIGTTARSRSPRSRPGE